MKARRLSLAAVICSVVLASSALLVSPALDASACIIFVQKFFRPPVLVSKSGDNYTLADVRWGFDIPENYRRARWAVQGVWKDTTFDASAVRRVFFVIEPLDCGYLPRIFSHNCIWFEFDPKKPARAADGSETTGLVFSGQSRFRDGRHRFMFLFCSKEDYFNAARLDKNKVYIYKLKLTDAQKSDLLRVAIAESVRRSDEETYDLLSNNCASNILVVFNEVLPDSQYFNQWLVYKKIFHPAYCMKNAVVLMLYYRGLVEKALRTFDPSKD